MGRFRILTLNNIAPAGLARLPAERFETGSALSDPHAILLRSADLNDLPVPPSLLAVGRAGAGVNNIPLQKMSELGIPVFNAPGANANAVKELVLAAMLLGCRNICQAWHYTEQLSESGEALARAVEAGKKQFSGFELPGRTLGVVGLGAIGVRVANAALALGMKVIGFDPAITVQRAWELDAQVEQAQSVNDVLNHADCVTFHVPLIDATRNLINAERLAAMKDNVVIINFARQGIVDDEAVLAGLDSGKVWSYVCDFPSPQLIAHPRAISLPHLGASTAEAEENCAVMVAGQVRDYLENGVVRNSVNFPQITLPRSGQSRIVIANRNQPDMLGQISHAIGSSGLNICHMQNESRGDLAYTVVDLEQTVPETCSAALRRIDGVLRVRTIDGT
ncbi:phosphoglycerate dehydrogenase [Granulosicoccaceae sp. 1_MG-2023]|nr:phosphoglycerate dehydrogenase [Granulosicoccaceae sp. 1_MG-2023]